MLQESLPAAGPVNRLRADIAAGGVVQHCLGCVLGQVAVSHWPAASKYSCICVCVSRFLFFELKERLQLVFSIAGVWIVMKFKQDPVIKRVR